VVDKSIHPFRTRRLGDDGLEPWAEIPSNVSSNRQSMDPCVILDGAARAIRVSSCFPVHGFPPFPYLGKKVLFVENEGGRDVHNEDDIYLSEQFLLKQGWTPENTGD
ncbi:MAG: hypothetical protein KAG66_22610, partial [Methylococcales bacterium]|nr:hypothetical protein [Methylococcales bacterium]